MANGEEVLQQLLENADTDYSNKIVQPSGLVPTTPEGPPEKKSNETHSQWAIGGNGKFMPVGSTIPKLKAGVYIPFSDPGSWGLEQLNISSDGIYQLPDMATEEVLTEIHKFWNSEDRYRKHNLLYKRGLLLWGPPGGGKTVTVKLLMQEIIKRDGIVINVNHVGLAIMALKAIRRIEPTRNLIVVFEDIDEIINYSGEAAVLSMLDGENNIDNILQVATTNYPEKLGARIINRPSRFDRRIYVGMPGEEARQTYLIKATQDGLHEREVQKWVKDTDGMSIAHLRELVAAVYCLDQPYVDVIDRLKAMSIPPKPESGFANKGLGFQLRTKLATSAFSLPSASGG